MPDTSMHTCQLLVLGSGPGGYAAAFRAADLGLRTTLVDLEPRPGGVCLHRGCIPSKALLHAAAVMHDARRAAEFGVSFEPPHIDLAQLRAWKDGIVGQLTGGLETLCGVRKVTYVQGRGTFRDAHTLAVVGADGSEAVWQFEHAIVATGSRPSVPPPLRLDSPRVWKSDQALSLTTVPESLLVVGGGYIGLELGSVYAALGSAVTVVEMEKRLLPGADRDLVKVLTDAMRAQLHGVLLSTTVTALGEEGDAIRVTFDGADAPEAEQRFSHVLIAVGRRPNSEDLGLETTRAAIDAQGFIQVDGERRTAEPSIFAIGDVAGEPMLAHKATHEGQVAADVIAGRAAVFNPAAVPAVVFTHPEVAWCGLTELEAKAQGRKVKAVRFPWSASGRALILGAGAGVTKLVLDPETEQVLGVGIAGPGAGDLIAECVLAVELEATAEDLGAAIHPHPTLSETLMEAADLFHGLSAHLYRPR